MPNERSVEARTEVRRHLYERPTMAVSSDSIVRGLHYRGRFTEIEVLQALHYLLGKAQVKQVADDLGGGLTYWQITADGIDAHDRL